jgi:hypothetical protein
MSPESASTVSRCRTCRGTSRAASLSVRQAPPEMVGFTTRSSQPDAAIVCAAAPASAPRSNHRVGGTGTPRASSSPR